MLVFSYVCMYIYSILKRMEVCMNVSMYVYIPYVYIYTNIKNKVGLMYVCMYVCMCMYEECVDSSNLWPGKTRGSCRPRSQLRINQLRTSTVTIYIHTYSQFKGPNLVSERLIWATSRHRIRIDCPI